MLSRRRLVGAAAAGLGLAGASAIGLGVAGLAGGEAGAQGGSTAAAGKPGAFVEPPVLRARNGVLETTLEAQPDLTEEPGRMNYSGLVPGPTLRVRPGDRIRVRLVNNLGGDATNLHVHGLHVSPRENGDNVFLHVMNGESFDYEFAIPANHPSGLFWYHPHVHGDSMQQVDGGLAGAIVIEGGLDELPGVAGVPERLLVLQGPVIDPRSNTYQHVVNRHVNPTIAIRPGQTQRWRILNASANSFYNLQLAGHQLHRLGIDGNPLPAMATLDAMLLGPGERSDVLVRGGAPGSYALTSLAWGERGQAQPEFVVATIVSDGPAQKPAPLPTTLFPIVDLSDAAIDRRREVTFQENGQAPYFAIDGKAFDEDRVDQTVELGATEEWVVRNASPEWHPFHIHVNDFQVMSVDGVPQPPHYEDTVPVPPDGEVVIRTRFLDFAGRFVYHCHILGHEDAGMMGVVEVVEGGAGATPAAMSGA